MTSGRERAAVFAGTLLRNVARGFPGTVGPALLVLGVALIYVPAALILAGLILWSIDRRIS